MSHIESNQSGPNEINPLTGEFSTSEIVIEMNLRDQLSIIRLNLEMAIEDVDSKQTPNRESFIAIKNAAEKALETLEELKLKDPN